ncbi:hypothetical protein D3C83_29240 [compost metagenome]
MKKRSVSVRPASVAPSMTPSGVCAGLVMSPRRMPSRAAAAEPLIASTWKFPDPEAESSSNSSLVPSALMLAVTCPLVSELISAITWPMVVKPSSEMKYLPVCGPTGALPRLVFLTWIIRS